MRQDTTNLPFPRVETIDVGPVRIHWLSPDVACAGEEWLTLEDQRFAEEIKAPLRRSEFVRSRLLIRQLTGWRGSLAKTPTGAPGWPEGHVGSLTHKDGWVGVALKKTHEASSLGIDAEDVARLKPGFEAKILTPGETERMAAWSKAMPRLEVLATIFSFKESLFKAVYPLGAKMFYFLDAEVVTFDPSAGRLAAKLLMDTSPLTPANAVVPGHFAFYRSGERHFVLSSTELHGVADAGVGG